MLDDEVLFADDDVPETPTERPSGWRILVIDDEPEIHQITRLVLNDFHFDNLPLSLEFASSAAEAKVILEADTERTIAVAIVDVVMESNHAGLDLIRWVRDELQNHTIRIVLRTGQPGEAPEESVIRDYDINDYKNKTELTALRLKTSIFAALRGYRDIKVIETHRRGLERIIDATSTFIECDSLSEFACAILGQISVVLGIENNDIVCCALTREKLVDGHTELNVLAHNSRFDNPLTPEIKARIDAALAKKQNHMSPGFFVGYFTTKRGTENVLYVAQESPMEDVQHHLLSSFAHNIAVAHENLKLREIIKESQRELSYVIGEAVELRSKETGSHVKRVAHISHLLATLYGLSERDAELIQLASPLHDVGKVGIPDNILNKPGPHSDDEQRVMRTHAKIGFDMLCKSDNPILQLGAHIAHEHHECWDGSGYPRGLYQGEIHVAGRISAVADVFDALGSKRCYKEPWSDDAILDYFLQEKGKRFEPLLVDLLVSNIDEFRAIRQRFPDPV